MTESMNVRLRSAERKLFEMAAEKDKRRLSDWVRLALLEAARQRLDATELIEAVEKQVVR